MAPFHRRSPGGRRVRQAHLAGGHLPQASLGEQPALLHQGNCPHQQHEVLHLGVGALVGEGIANHACELRVAQATQDCYSYRQ